MKQQYDGLVLYSGGLDSILAARALQSQGLKILGLHFVTPFFGQPDKISRWQSLYTLDIMAVDVSEDYVRMLFGGPRHGFGKHLNPCMDCKVLMLARAREMLGQYGARFIASGEVLGQRPMSQRRDALNAIRRDAGVRDLLLRPLCAKLLDPIPAETSGLVDRERLFAFSGRGRSNQLGLAAAYGITAIPGQAGGCPLTIDESCRRYAPLFRRGRRAVRDGAGWRPAAGDFRLAGVGRQFWTGRGTGRDWLVVGRDERDNLRIEELVRDTDLLLLPGSYSGPLALLRSVDGAAPAAETVREAAALAASYAPRAVRSGGEVEVRVRTGGLAGQESRDERVRVLPRRDSALFSEPMPWPEAKQEMRDEARPEAMAEEARPGHPG
jgi:hypothetical protein